MMSFAVVTIVKATLVCGVTFVLSRLCRRTRASIRHLLFALAFAALVAIPAAGSFVPSVEVKVPAATASDQASDMVSAVQSSTGAVPSASSRSSLVRHTAPTRTVAIAASPGPADAGQPGPFRPFASVLESNAPRLLAALEEQLGFKIESQLAPKPVLVIESIEDPAEN